MPFPLKISYNGDVRRFQLNSPSLSQLREALTQAYNETSDAYILKYYDDEQELVTITTQTELDEAINVVGKDKVLKVFVTVKDGAAKNTTSAASEPVAAITIPVAEPVVVVPAAKPVQVQVEAPVTSSPTSTLTDAAPTPAPTVVDSKPAVDDKRAETDFSDPRNIINLLLELLSDATFLRVLPSLAITAIDSIVSTQSFQQSLENVVLAGDELKNHASVIALLPHARRLALFADEKYGYLHGFIVNSPFIPLARQDAEMIPTFIPRVVEYLMAFIDELEKAEKQDDYNTTTTTTNNNNNNNNKKQETPQDVLSAFLQQGWRCHPVAALLRGAGVCGSRGAGGCPMRDQWAQRRADGCRRFEQQPDTTATTATPAAIQQTSTTSAPTERVHDNIICDMCDVTPIRGIRYKCLVCDDYDLCSACEATERHPADHPLIKITKGKTTLEESIHRGVSCDGCRQYPIRGIRYKCSTCPNYDLCSTCEGKNVHDQHNMIKIKTPASGRIAHAHVGLHPQRVWVRRFHFPRREQTEAFTTTTTTTTAVAVPVPVPATPSTEVSAVTPAPAPAPVPVSAEETAPAPITTLSAPVSILSTVIVENEQVVEDVKEDARQDVAVAPTSAPLLSAPLRFSPVLIVPSDDFVHVEKPAAASPVVEAAPTSSPTSAPTSSPSPTPAPAPVAAAASATSLAFESSYPIQNNALVSMGFVDRDLNEWVLSKKSGNLQDAANWLLERIKL